MLDHSLKISRTKTEYIKCNFSGLDDSEGNTMKIENNVVARCNKYRYFNSMADSQGGFDSDITNRIGEGWVK